MISITQDVNFFKIFVVIYVLLITFEPISHYPIIDSAHWFKKYV